MMKGTPGGIVEMFGGVVAYLCLAITLALVKDVSSREKIRPVSARTLVFQAPFRSSGRKLSLPDRAVLFGLLAFRRGDVFHMMSKTAGSRSRHRRRPGEEEKP